MNRLVRKLLVLLACCASAWAADPVIQSTWADSDPPLETSPTSWFWRGSQTVYMDRDTYGKPHPKYRTEIRTRWTEQNLYILFVCPYEELNLKPNPNASAETNELWNWDVAEAFMGADFKNVRRYKEFELSPQGEWVDLDIDLDEPHHEKGWKWNSGLEVSARIDRDAMSGMGQCEFLTRQSIVVRQRLATNFASTSFAAKAHLRRGSSSRGKLLWATASMFPSDSEY